jgi:parallel beta-helix repeat protein
MKPSRESGTSRTRRVVVVGLVVVALAIASVGVVNAQRASGPTGIDSCTTINSSGKYVLTTNVTGGRSGHCITVTASDVVLAGGGHTVSGHGSSRGIFVNGSSRPVTNVTVQNVRTSNWSSGVFYLSTDNSTIRGTVADDNIQGLTLAASDRNRLVDNTAYANNIGIAVGGESQNNTLRNNVAVENEWGIHFERDSPNNTVVNNTARNNTKWDYYSLRNGGTNNVTNLHLSTTTVSFTERNVALRSVTSPPPLPRGTRSLGTFVETMATNGQGSSLSVTMGYDARATNGSSVSLWRNNGRSWSRVRRAQVNPRAATVTANLTEFGVLAPLARARGSAGGPVTVSPDESAPVQRTLTTAAPTPTSTATATRTPNGSGSNGSTTTPNAPPTAVQSPTAGNAERRTTTAGVARGESDATTSTFGIGPVRLLFVLLGLVGLVALGVVAIRERTGRDNGF